MKNKITLMALGLGTLLMINACQTPEERTRDEKAATDNTTDATTDNQNKDNTTADMPPSDTQAVTPADNSATGTDATASTGKAAKGKKGKASVGKEEPNTSDKMEMDKSGVYARTEIMPAYPGGQSSLEKFVENNLQYPQEAIDNGIEGKVMISFDVDETGKIYRPMVVSEKLGYGLEEEALRIVKEMPQWSPGKMKGKNVKTKFTLPIVYQLI